jgi:TetR/AcrR family tetracycline transcriptional repressor
VLAAARRLLVEGGSRALTMRAVARQLGVAPNALYSHVASRTALLDELLDELLAEVKTPTTSDTDDPVAGLHALMSSTYETLLAAPDLVPLYLVRHGARGPNAIRLGDVVDALLERAGVAPASVIPARRVLIVHTIGAAAFATAAEGEPAAPPLSTKQLQESFALSLGWLLTGISAAIDRPRDS